MMFSHTEIGTEHDNGITDMAAATCGRTYVFFYKEKPPDKNIA